MANKYVRSTDGNDADDGTTWALADATLAGASAADAAGDVIWVSQAHSETTAAAISFDWAGTAASPTRIICGNDAAEPPTALATTALVATTGASDITIASSGTIYVYGITFSAGSAGSAANVILGNATGVIGVFDTCKFTLNNTSGSSDITLSGTASSLIAKDCTFKFGGTSQSIVLGGTRGNTIEGGSIDATGSAITVVFVVGGKCRVSGFDMSGAAAAANLCSNNSTGVSLIVRNCKLPASWSGSINSSTPGAGSVYELHNSDSADTNYRYQRKTQFGNITGETTVVKTGGASDGTTTISWKMVTTADTEWNHQTLVSGEIVKWNETTGSAITVTVDIIHDSVTNVTDKEIWLEVQYLGTSGTPLALFVNDAAADYITAANDQTDSSSTWTTTGLTNPNTQQLNVTFTPQEKGFIHAVVKMAKASYTVYVDPELVVT